MMELKQLKTDLLKALLKANVNELSDNELRILTLLMDEFQIQNIINKSIENQGDTKNIA